jgi:hypothetical protein
MGILSVLSGKKRVSASKRYSYHTRGRNHVSLDETENYRPKHVIYTFREPKETSKSLKMNRMFPTASEYELLIGIYHIIGMRLYLDTEDLIPGLSNGWKFVEPIASAVLNLVYYIDGASASKSELKRWSYTVRDKLLKLLEKLRGRSRQVTTERRSWDSWSDAQGFDVLVCYVLGLYLCAAIMEEQSNTEDDLETQPEDPPFGCTYSTTSFILLDKALLHAINVSPITADESRIFEEHFGFCQADFEAVEKSSHDKRNIQVFLSEHAIILNLRLQGRYRINLSVRTDKRILRSIDTGMTFENWKNKHNSSLISKQLRKKAGIPRERKPKTKSSGWNWFKFMVSPVSLAF